MWQNLQMGVWLFKMLILFLFYFFSHHIWCLASWYLMGITVKKFKSKNHWFLSWAMPFGPEHSCYKGPVISGNAPALGHDYPIQDQVFNFKNSFISPLQNMKSRKTNKTSMLIFLYLFFNSLLGSSKSNWAWFQKKKKKEWKKMELKMDYWTKKGGGVCMCEFGVCVCVSVCVCEREDLTNRF